jgi:hypothetical protein
MSNNEHEKLSIIADVSFRNHPLDVARPEAHRPPDHDPMERAGGDQSSDGSHRHVEDLGRLAGREERLKARRLAGRSTLTADARRFPGNRSAMQTSPCIPGAGGGKELSCSPRRNVICQNLRPGTQTMSVLDATRRRSVVGASRVR